MAVFFSTGNIIEPLENIEEICKTKNNKVMFLFIYQGGERNFLLLVVPVNTGSCCRCSLSKHLMLNVVNG